MTGLVAVLATETHVHVWGVSSPTTGVVKAYDREDDTYLIRWDRHPDGCASRTTWECAALVEPLS